MQVPNKEVNNSLMVVQLMLGWASSTELGVDHAEQRALRLLLGRKRKGTPP